MFTLGDRPEDRWPEAQQWLDELGYDSTLDYVRAMAVRVLEETGLLPHLNPGVMSWSEINRLKAVAPSMGMMLETTSRRLFEEKGQAHHGSPDKDPAVRLRVLEDAGRLSVPFTTGILVGIGEDLTERAESIFALRKVAQTYGHVQEVIVQNFRAKPDTAMRSVEDLGLDEYLAAVAVARVVLGPKMRVQAPPNLVDSSAGSAECALLLGAGVDDWGGVSPLTPDHVNPERPWPSLERLRSVTADSGFALLERLTAHPEYVRAGEPWIDPRVAPHVRALATPDGLAVEGARPVGLPWQEPDGGFGTGRGRAAPTCTPPSTPPAAPPTAEPTSRTSTALGPSSATASPTTPPRRFRRWVRTARQALKRGRERPRSTLTDEQALTLMTADGAVLDEVRRIADGLRRETVGDDVTYVVNRNINFTNVCYTGCRFCAFAQRRTDADAFSLSLTQVADRAEEAWTLGASEVCMQGGIDPEMPGTGYFDLVRAVKDRVPGMHVHAFSPMEVVNGAARTGMSIREWLSAAKDAGLDTIPGTAAEILDDDVRWILTKGKLPTSAWIEVVTTAHELGIRSSSTMMYGHVDTPRALGGAPAGAPAHPGRHRRLHRVRPVTVRAHQRPDLPRRRRPSRPLAARQPRRARGRADHAARPHRQHPDLLGQARRRRHPRDAHQRRQRPRRHPDGGDHLPDGRLRARLRQDRRRAHRDRRRHRSARPRAHHHLPDGGPHPRLTPHRAQRPARSSAASTITCAASGSETPCRCASLARKAKDWAWVSS